jgi:photosystem II stability/assembly factor-like uncharacterized protein
MTNRIAAVTLLAWVGLTAMGCGAGGEKVSTETVREAPSSSLSPQTQGVDFDAQLISPLDGAMAVATDAVIRIRFNHTPDTSAEIILSDTLGTLQTDLLCNGPDCELLPIAPLASDSVYHVTVTAGSRAMDPSHGMLHRSRVWAFSTGDNSDRASLLALTPMRTENGWVAGVHISPRGGDVSIALSTAGVADGPWQVQRATSVFMAPLKLNAHSHHILTADLVGEAGPLRPVNMPLSIGWTDSSPVSATGLDTDGLNDVTALSRDLLWTAGDTGTILNSNDGGHSWTEQHHGGSNLAALKMITPNNGWAVGDMGTVLHYDGFAWSPVAVPSNADLRDVLFVGAERGWMVGSGGTVLRTDDGGETWNNLEVPTQQGLNAITCYNLSRCHLAGNAGTVLTTTDGGDSWNTVATPTFADLNGIQILADGSGWISGEGGILLAGNRDGNWIVRGTTGQSTVNSLSFTPDGHGWAAGSGNSVVGTEDGGRNWQALPLPGYAALSALAHHGNNQLVAVGQDAAGNGIILRTDTGGKI